MKLKDKVAIVTGAGSGMGQAIALHFSDLGAKVVVSDINEEAVHHVVNDIKEKDGIALGIVANVSVQEDVDYLIQTTMDTYEGLDILVNNAGILDNFIPVGEIIDDEWDKVIAVNLTGPMKLSRAAIQVMDKQEHGGVIINNASVGGLFGSRGGAAYTASKHGLLGLTKNIAATYGTFGKIRCNAIAPGGVKTNIQTTITKPSGLGYKALENAGPGPLAESNEIAQVAGFLASDESSFVNGAIITADGGWTAR